MARRANWKMGSNDLGLYIECSKCKHKLSAKQVIFADKSIAACPFCKSKMSMEDVKFGELVESLEQ